MMEQGQFYSKLHGNFKMKQFFLLLFLLSTSLFALNINESLLKIHATLVPKIYLMDYQFKNKLKNNTISIAIIYQANEYHDAKNLQLMIQNRYKKGIQSYKVDAILKEYKDVKNCDANIYYLFPASQKEIRSVITEANTHHSLTFSYQKDDLKYGVMISLNISKKIKPLLNLEAIKKHNIALRPVLINISTIYFKELESEGFYNSKVIEA